MSTTLLLILFCSFLYLCSGTFSTIDVFLRANVSDLTRAYTWNSFNTSNALPIGNLTSLISSWSSTVQRSTGQSKANPWYTHTHVCTRRHQNSFYYKSTGIRNNSYAQNASDLVKHMCRVDWSVSFHNAAQPAAPDGDMRKL